MKIIIPQLTSEKTRDLPVSCEAAGPYGARCHHHDRSIPTPRRKGRTRPDWVFASVTGTALDESDVRKALNRILDAAELDRRGPHQMRHTFASLLLQDGVPITYVSRQRGHKDGSITLRVYAHWLPDSSNAKLVMCSTRGPAQPPDGPRRVDGVRSNRVKCFAWSGEPKFRQLEPAGRVVEAGGGAETGGVKPFEVPPPVGTA